MIGKKFAKPLQDDLLVIVDNEKTGESHTVKNDASNTFEKYAEVANWCNETQKATIEDKGDYYEVVPLSISEPTEAEKAQAEIASLKSELASYDYIGTKIAMGVATREDYAEEIAHTEELRARINQLEPIALEA